MTSRDKAVILRRKPFGEADLMLTLYTEKNGKIRVVAKGARRITSKLLGYTELFTIITCQLNFRSSIPIVSQIQHVQLFDGVADNPHLYHELHLVAELIDRGCEDSEPNPTLFYALTHGIEQLVRSDHPLMGASMIMRLSLLLGVAPQVTLCAACGEPITAVNQIGWSEQHGGMVTCESGLKESSPLTLDEAKILRYLVKAPYSEVETLRLASPLADRVQGLLLHHMQHALDQEFTTLKTASPA